MNAPNSTFLVSERTNWIASLLQQYTMLAKMLLSSVDLPEPVLPLTSRCGSVARSSMNGLPRWSTPKLRGTLMLSRFAHTLFTVSRKWISCRSVFGTKTATALSPGNLFTITSSTPSTTARSPHSPSK